MKKDTILFILFLILVGVFVFVTYNWGKSSGAKDCVEEKVQVQKETIEVIKYVYKEDTKILLRPDSDFSTLLKRMRNNEI